MLGMQPSRKITSNFFLRKRDENFFMKLPSKQKISPVALLLSSAAYCKQSVFEHAAYFALQYFTLFPAYHCQKDERPLSGHLRSSKRFLAPK